MNTLTVGGLAVESEQATAWANEYLRGPYGESSYPAYDAYEGSGPDSPLLGDADLLAPVLLNVAQKPVKTYYSLQALMPTLNDLLQDVPTQLALDEATEEDLGSVAALFSVLDADPAPKQVRMTTLAKVLARKRPGLIPVYDEAVAFCYTEAPGAPVPWQKGRTWEGYARAWIEAVRADLVRHHREWEALAATAPEDLVPISPLRALDIVAWKAGQKALADLPPKRRGRRAAEVAPV